MATSSFTIKKWIIYTGIGWFLGVLLVLLLAGLLEFLHLDFQFIVGFGMGLGVGLSHWLLLRKYFLISFNWVVIQSIVLTIPFLIFDIFSRYYNLPIEKLILFIIACGVTSSSYLQYYFLLKPNSPNTKEWILFSLIGWLSVSILCIYSYPVLMHYFTRNIVVIVNLIIFTSAGPLLGFITWKGIDIKVSDY